MSTASTQPRLGRIGIWSLELRFGDPAEAADAAVALDEWGFGAIWIPGGVGGDILGDLGRLVSVTRKAVIATGIINIWKHQPEEVSTWWHEQSAERQARVLLGLGVSHGPLIGEAYNRPLAAMRAYLAKLNEQGVPHSALCLAALAPKMLELSRDHSAGTHPYLVPPEHTALARKIIGPDALLAPEQGVVLERDPTRARELCRNALDHYRNLPNYVNNWMRLGFTADEIATLSDRLIDTLFAWGGTDQVVERVNAHIAAGADHVCLQVITGSPRPNVGAALSAWRELADALL